MPTKVIYNMALPISFSVQMEMLRVQGALPFNYQYMVTGYIHDITFYVLSCLFLIFWATWISCTGYIIYKIFKQIL